MLLGNISDYRGYDTALERRDALSLQSNFTRFQLLQSGNAFQKRCLPATIRPEKTENTRRINSEIKAIKDR
jgi:hypothetical protein